MCFHPRVWYRVLSLRYACIQSLDIILIPCATFVPNFVSFAASIAELGLGEKSRTQSLSHLPGLFDGPGTEAFASEQNIQMSCIHSDRLCVLSEAIEWRNVGQCQTNIIIHVAATYTVKCNIKLPN